MRPAPSGIDGASTEFTCICARATRGDHGEGEPARWRVKGMVEARGWMQERGGEEEGRQGVARSRSRREKPSKCRGPCIQAAR